MKDYKEYIVEKLIEIGVEDSEGNYYKSQEIYDRFDDFLCDISKEELIEWVSDYIKEYVTSRN